MPEVLTDNLGASNIRYHPPPTGSDSSKTTSNPTTYLAARRISYFGTVMFTGVFSYFAIKRGWKRPRKTTSGIDIAAVAPVAVDPALSSAARKPAIGP